MDVGMEGGKRQLTWKRGCKIGKFESFPPPLKNAVPVEKYVVKKKVRMPFSLVF